MSNAAPNRHDRGSIQLITMFCEPQILLRRAEPDPYEVRSGLVQSIDHRLPLVDGQRAKRRRLNADDLKPRKSVGQAVGQLSGDTLASAVEIVTGALGSASIAEVREHVRPAHPTHLQAARPSHPDERYAVRHDHPSRLEDVPQVWPI